MVPGIRNRNPSPARMRPGPRFDIKGFHDAVLNYGSVPLEVMGNAVDLWAPATS